jgi:hypothetical protein
MRNKFRLGVIASALPLFLLAGIGAIADPATPSVQGNADTAAQSKPKAQNQKTTPAAKAGVEPPTDTFTPSETISADSAVSFPVDI